ncbi:MAG: class I SAM-dependent methyltransferase, partial [Deltaproteobacteria bacterium]|nr:class I SAM-dependent methyltransferase [Deltaproteobacteria bacterium]
GVPGDLVECGVWRGGASVFLRGLLEAHQDPDRRVWVADSFQGLPAASTGPDRALGVDLTEAAAPLLAVDLDTVCEAFEVHGLLDERVRFVPGWFKDSLPASGIEQIALLRLDGDLYESTRDALEALWDRVSPGGVVVIDDWVLPPCRQAVEEFLGPRGGLPEIERVDWAAVAFRKR